MNLIFYYFYINCFFLQVPLFSFIIILKRKKTYYTRIMSCLMSSNMIFFFKYNDGFFRITIKNFTSSSYKINKFREWSNLIMRKGCVDVINKQTNKQTRNSYLNQRYLHPLKKKKKAKNSVY